MMAVPVRTKPPSTLSSHVVQGEQRVSDEPDAMLTTLLGSCVAACLRDPVVGVGGMNHFLLPGTLAVRDGAAARLGVHAMELLINALLARGASRRRLEAKIFGGAQIKAGLTDVGAQNAAFAREFLQREDIPVVSECLGGTLGRRVQFWPASGRARRTFMQPSMVPPQAPAAAAAPQMAHAAAGTLDLF